MEASALTHASQRGLLARRSPLLKLQGDERLIAMARSGNAGAFEAIVDRYQGRLLGFCRQMLGSTEDAEDVLQEVFVNAYRAMLADEREINLRPWLYRIARNRCLNHLRKPSADAQESMDQVPVAEGASTAERVHNREEFRQILCDVGKLPETQRTALMLREMDMMSYEEIAHTMETSVPSVKSLLVRARISLAEASQARQLTCGEVRLELAEAAEGLRKVSGPARRHVRGCKECTAFRTEIRSNSKVLAALVPVGPLAAFKSLIASKLGFGGGTGAGAGAGTATGIGATATAGGAGTVGSVGAAIGGGGAAGGIGAIGGAIGTKAVAGVVTAAVLTAGAVEVKEQVAPPPPVSRSAAVSRAAAQPQIGIAPQQVAKPENGPSEAPSKPSQPTPASTEAPVTAPPAAAPEAPTDSAAGPSSTTADESPASSPIAPAVVAAKTPPSAAGAPSGEGVVIVVTSPAPATPASAEAPPPPAEEAAPAPSEPPPAAPPAAESPPSETTQASPGTE